MLNGHARQKTTPRQCPSEQAFLTAGMISLASSAETTSSLPADSNAMDWTKTNTALRALWVSKEELKKHEKKQVLVYVAETRHT
jgi:hypothetical protein